MAAALFTKYSGIKAFSAGTKVLGKEGQKLKEIPLAKPVLKFMKKEGLDMAENTRTQYAPKMIKNFDKIIIMAEPETIPPYLLKNNKVIVWHIENPKGRDNKDYKKIISQIKSKVKSFIKENALSQ